jgi:hypothetical protein
MVLILGSLADPHVKSVCAFLDRWRKPYLLIDPFLPRPEECYWRLANGDPPRLSIANKIYEAAEITHVWWRVKPTFAEYKSGIDIHALKFKEREWSSFLEGLENLLCQAKWINPRISDRRFRYKGNQLVHAVDCGFVVPPTVIGNTPGVKAILGSRLIYKPFTYYFEPPDKMTYTTDISEADLTDEQFLDTPGIYQENIGKDRELRITVVEDSVFCCRIDPTFNRRSMQDWRAEIFSVKYEPETIDPALLEKLLIFHKTAGINFGAYDFIVRDNGEFVFLEVNTVGQWLWIEEATGLEISQAVAKSLVS